MRLAPRPGARSGGQLCGDRGAGNSLERGAAAAGGAVVPDHDFDLVAFLQFILQARQKRGIIDGDPLREQLAPPLRALPGQGRSAWPLRQAVPLVPG